MARRPTQPPLYELIRDKATLSARPPVPAPEIAPPPGDLGLRVVRTVRVPVGYLWVTVAVVFAGLVLAYIVGYTRGSASVRGERAEDLAARIADASGGLDDPLTRSGDSTGNSAGGSDGRSGAGSPQDGGRGGAGLAGSGGLTDSGPDPRRDGWYYFVLAHPPPDKAQPMVDFLRANGLDAHAVSVNNARLRKVIVLPGYADKADRQSKSIKELEARIRAVGLRWKNQVRGNRDFGDAYPERFRG